MQKFILFIITILLLQDIAAQRDPRGTTILTTTTFSTQQVTLFEHGNFTGQSKSFGPGTYRFSTPADFNDIVSSIRVPAGMAVMIYEHANETGGFGAYVDLLEDCPDLTAYNLNDKISYINVFAVSRTDGFVWARNRMVNGEFIPGHWERKRANGQLPDNAAPGVVSQLSGISDPMDIANAPLASPADIAEFDKVQQQQLGVGVLGGETTRPFYYHHNQPGETVYKYDKVIDPARLPGGFFDWAADKLGGAGIIVKPVEVVVDFVGDLKDFIFGSSSTKMQMDCWFPVSEFRQTVCGKLTSNSHVCTQDYLHTQVTVDKDVCYNLKPAAGFTSYLTNRWTGETHQEIEGEVKPKKLTNLNTQTGKTNETTTPRNPLLLQLKKDENVCLYGPWMGDILDINLKVPIPLTDKSVSLANIDLRKNNEIHPVNQLWRKVGKEIHMVAIADGTGYFQKRGNGEIEASGLHQKMRFYIAFTLPAITTVLTRTTLVYDVNGIGFDFTDTPPPAAGVNPETVTLKDKGVVRVQVNDNTILRTQRTHRVFFDKVRKRANGMIQGYIVIETEKISKQGGSINIFVKDQTVNNSPVGPGGGGVISQ